MIWHIVTGEYPPALGGVAAYSALLAQRLAADGDTVHVWTRDSGPAPVEGPGVVVHRYCSMGGSDLRRLDADLDAVSQPRRILVQWVPHAFGRRSMNVSFALWMLRRARRGDEIDLMVHEAFLPFGGSWRQFLAAGVHRLMIVAALRAATTVWITIPRWAGVLRPFLPRSAPSMFWVPVPSNVPVTEDTSGLDAIRRSTVGAGDTLIGHFGTYGRTAAPLLERIAVGLLEADDRRVLLLIGTGGDRFRADFERRHPGLARRVHATGTLPLSDVSLHLAACDILIQPYIDGVSTRRGTVMAALAHGRPVVTTSGPATESLWESSEAVLLASADDPPAFIAAAEELIADRTRRGRIGGAGRALYHDRFAMDRTVSALRGRDRMTIDGRADLPPRTTASAPRSGDSGVGATVPADRAT